MAEPVVLIDIKALLSGNKFPILDAIQRKQLKNVHIMYDKEEFSSKKGIDTLTELQNSLTVVEGFTLRMLPMEAKKDLGPKHPKVALVEEFMQRSPTPASSIIVIDNDKDAINALKAYKDTKPSIPMTPIFAQNQKKELDRGFDQHFQKSPGERFPGLFQKDSQAIEKNTSNIQTSSSVGFLDKLKNYFGRIKDFAKANPWKALGIGIAVAIGIAAIGVGIAFSGGLLALPVAAAAAGASAGIGALVGGMSAGAVAGAIGIVGGTAVIAGTALYTDKEMRRAESRQRVKNLAKNEVSSPATQIPHSPEVKAPPSSLWKNGVHPPLDPNCLKPNNSGLSSEKFEDMKKGLPGKEEPTDSYTPPTPL